MARFVRQEGIDLEALVDAIRRAEDGLVDAHLGGGLIKRRVARKGQGRSGGYRTIIAYRRADRAVFLLGFAKSMRSNVTLEETAEFRKIGSNWLNASNSAIAEAMNLGEAGGGCAMTRAKRLSKVGEAILEMASDLHSLGLMDDAAYTKITVRHLGEKAHKLSKPISPREIRSMRKRAKLSQAAMASMLNLTPGYVSQLERGTKEPKGPSLALLNIIRNKGFEAIL